MNAPINKSDAFDLAVIGAGSAGFSAAITAAGKGARVALIGHGVIGGTCVNVGCVPSKALLRAAEALHNPRHAARFGGIRADSELQDWSQTIAAKDDLVAAMRQSKYIDLLPEYDGIEYLEGKARLVEGGVDVDGRIIEAPKIVIATGSHPAQPDIPGITDVPWLDSTAALAMAELPDSLLVIGAGFIGCELAQIFARTGVKVTLAFRSRILPGTEPEIGAALGGIFADEGIDVRAGVQYRAIRRDGSGVALEIEDSDGRGKTIRADAILAAVGRRPNTTGLELAGAGIEIDSRGGIKVDGHMSTNRAGVYAAGDVTGRDMYVYMAAHGARIAAENAVGGDQRRYDDSAIPAVVFTDPQAASVGLTEAAARARGIDARTSILPLEMLSRAQAARDTRGLIKLVADGRTDRLIGAHILAAEGGDSIQTAALAIRQGMTVSDLADMIFPYLTTVEGLKLAAQGFTQDVAKLSCCAG